MDKYDFCISHLGQVYGMTKQQWKRFVLLCCNSDEKLKPWEHGGVPVGSVTTITEWDSSRYQEYADTEGWSPILKGSR